MSVGPTALTATGVRPLPARVIRALSAAYPLPPTITEAAAEYAMWERRDRDVGLAVEDTSDSQLDLPAYLRREIVRRLLETGLRAESLAEVLIRQRHLVMSEATAPNIRAGGVAGLGGVGWGTSRRR